MKIKIRRYCLHRTPKPEIDVWYDIPLQDPTLLEALTYIKSSIDQTLTYSSGCRSGVCGSCSVLVNGKEQLACGYKINDGDIVEPLARLEVIKDLVVDGRSSFESLKKTKAYMTNRATKTQSKQNEKLIETQSDCILCNSCYSACPVLEVNPNFLAPFALTRVIRYIDDERNEDIEDKIKAIQKDGIWDCTLCGECTTACPQGIDPKRDIMNLRAKSGVFGYVDPNFFSGMSF
jgi:fumarate reductase iron-sulfur subunit